MTKVRWFFIGAVGVATAIAAGCGGSTDDSTGGGTDAGASDASMNGDSMQGDGAAQGDGSTLGDGGTAGDSGSVGTVGCGRDAMDAAATCDLATQVCCVSVGMGGADIACTAKGACMGGSIACEDSTNCSGGGVCCGTVDMTGISATCSATPCATGMGSAQLCKTAMECPMGDTCRQSGQFGGLGICRAPFDGGGPRDGGPRDGGPRDGASDAQGD